MKYKLLKDFYYTDKAKYEEEYDRRFNSEFTYHLNISINGNEAFFFAQPYLYEQIYKIVKNDCELFFLCKQLPSIAISHFIHKSLIGEIVGTNDIEQVHSTRKEISDYLGHPQKRTKRSRFKDIINRYNLLGQEHYDLKSCSDIRTIYDNLLYEEIKDESPSDLPDGEFFRRSGVNVHTATDKVIHKGITPESRIINYMTKALAFLNDENINLFFRIAVFHYLFGYIHPFYDGNGRMSRFISSALLYKNMSAFIIAYRLSTTIKENKNLYYKAFKECNDPKNKGDMTSFIYMFFEIILKSMDNLKASLIDKIDKLYYYEHNISLLPHSDIKHSHNIYFILIQASLFSENGICKKELSEALSINPGTLNNYFKKIPSELLNIKISNRTQFFSLDLDKFDLLIEDSAGNSK